MKFLRYEWFRKLFGKSKREKRAFPNWIVKTNEERIQNKTTMFEIEKRKGTEFTVTEKLDGQSATYFLRKTRWKKYEFGVCSRNIRLYKPDTSSYWKIAKKLDIEHVLRELIGNNSSVILQGEIVGPGIQGNKYKLDDLNFFAFNLIFPDRRVNTLNMPFYLSVHDISTVPILKDRTLLKDSIAEMVDSARDMSELLDTQKREGVVWRNLDRTISFKVINPDFSLDEEE